MRNPIEAFGGGILRVCEALGEAAILAAETIGQCRSVLQRPRRVTAQMTRVGYETLPLAAGVAIFTGMVLSLHTGTALRQYGALEMLAHVVSLSVVKEMAPVLTALLLAARIGASVAAEIGTMSVHEEIDALHTLGINPVKYLVMPRFVACVVMLPTLVIYADLIGIAGGGLIANVYYGVTWSSYIKHFAQAITFRDIVQGLIKATVFGGIIATVACHKGLTTTGGAEGVGRAITSCVVNSFIYIFIANYFITRALL